MTNSLAKWSDCNASCSSFLYGGVNCNLFWISDADKCVTAHVIDMAALPAGASTDKEVRKLIAMTVPQD